MIHMALTGKSILVVDDEPEVRAGIAKFFERQGCQTLQASSGKEAFQLILSQPFDAVVTDIRMPNGSGIELLAWIKSTNINKPVVFLITGFSDISEAELYAQGAEGVFQKPFQRKDLILGLERLLTPKCERWESKAESLQDPHQVRLGFLDFTTAADEHLISIGRGGLFVHVSNNLPLRGDLISFSIQFLSGPLLLIEGQGLVRWVRRESENGQFTGCGIEFLKLANGCHLEIAQWIESQKIRAYIPMC